MARITGSWLSGPSAALPEGVDGRTPQAFRGEWLGLPSEGPGSLAGTGRRLAALTIDWLTSAGVAALVIGEGALQGAIGTITLMVWFVVGVVTVSVFSFTPGQFCMGVQVSRIDGPHRVGVLRALGRQALLVFVVPGTITDVDGRGMQDRATGTAVLRTR